MLDYILEKEMDKKFIDLVLNLYFELKNTPIKDRKGKYFIEDEIDKFRKSLDTTYEDCKIGAEKILCKKDDLGRSIQYTSEALELAKEIIKY
jgi:hypothetical protein